MSQWKERKKAGFDQKQNICLVDTDPERYKQKDLMPPRDNIASFEAEFCTWLSEEKKQKQT